MNTSKTIGAVILAAGYASRLGTPKPLLPLGRSTVVEEATARFRTAGIEQVRVVVGYQAELITPLLDHLGVDWVLNEHYDRGMFSSVLTGVQSLGSQVEAFFLLPVDIPLVKPTTIRMLSSAYGNGRSWVIYPCFQGERGHPPLIATACLPRDLSFDHPGGLRTFLMQYERMARDVEVVDQAILLDCDTPSDYERMKAYAGREDIPTGLECEALWDHFGVPEKVIVHSRVVAQLARLLAIHLNRAGLELNLDLIVAAGYLHDVAKGQPDHAQKGGQMLAEIGYPRVAELVGSHMDIHPPRGSLNEAALLYLADKCVDGDQWTPFEHRFKRTLAKYAGQPEVLKAVEKRLQHARLTQRSIEKVLGQPLEYLIQTYKRNIRAVSNSGQRKIYLVRHGAVQRGRNGKRFIGQLDLPLSCEGIQQLQRLKAELCGAQLSAVFCSDLKRSAGTAGILTEMSPELSPIQKPELREISLGEWEGLTFDEVSRKHPEDFKERGLDLVHYQPPGGESFLDCTKRVIPAFYEMIHSTRGNILIVGHAGVNRIILCQVLGKCLDDLFEVEQDYGCLNVIHYKHGIFTLKVLNGNAV
jgi:molybdenum cofactor cytidylyltransferase